MNSNKFLIGGIVGGIVYFALGYLVYGVLLKDSMKSTVPGVDRADLLIWAIAVGNLFTGFLLSYVIGKAGSKSAGSGAGVGAVVGLLTALGTDFIMYGVSNLMEMKHLWEDVAVFTVLSAVAGAFVGWVYGMNKKAAA